MLPYRLQPIDWGPVGLVPFDLATLLRTAHSDSVARRCENKVVIAAFKKDVQIVRNSIA